MRQTHFERFNVRSNCGTHDGRTGNADWWSSGPRQLCGTHSGRAAGRLYVAIGTALSTRDADSSDRWTARLRDHVVSVDQQRTRLVCTQQPILGRHWLFTRTTERQH